MTNHKDFGPDRSKGKARRVIVGVVVVSSLVLGDGYVSAATPDNKIYACVNTGQSRLMRYVNYAAGDRCTAQEQLISWNITGVDGATGPQGPQGPAGADGLNGADGAVGATGPQGETGPAGATGPQGETGAAGATGPAGAAGPPGPVGMNYRGAFQSSRFPHGAYFARDVVRWQGALWFATTNVPVTCTLHAGGGTCLNGAPGQDPAWVQIVHDGAKGAAGPAGEQGIQGPKGDTGATGPAGGPAGPQGETGPAGPQGATGPAGPAGPTGAVGMNHRGTFQSRITDARYFARDTVRSQSALWFAMTDIAHSCSNSSGPFVAGTCFNGAPGQDPAWVKIVQDGAAGEQGIQGPKGDTGAQGPAGSNGGDSWLNEGLVDLAANGTYQTVMSRGALPAGLYTVIVTIEANTKATSPAANVRCVLDTVPSDPAFRGDAVDLAAPGSGSGVIRQTMTGARSVTTGTVAVQCKTGNDSALKAVAAGRMIITRVASMTA